MKGILKVNRAQWGNEYLEVKDYESKITRFIHPGRKIIEISPGPTQTEVIIRDSRRVQLAVIRVPNKGFNSKNGTFYSFGPDIQQVFDLKGERKRVALTDSTLPKSGSVKCKSGWTGTVWRVNEYRYDYIVHFVNRANGQDIGTFEATGEKRVAAQQVQTRECLVPEVNYKAKEEIFQ